MPRRWTAPTAITSLRELEGRRVSFQLATGTIITSDMLIPSTDLDPTESEIAINPPPGGHEAEFDAWAWKPMQALPDLIVPFKRKVYEEVVAAFRHLAP